MLIKSADDKSKRLALLEDLQNSPVLDAWQKNKLREALLRLRKGKTTKQHGIAWWIRASLLR